jgi:hypothetical protein
MSAPSGAYIFMFLGPDIGPDSAMNELPLNPVRMIRGQQPTPKHGTNVMGVFELL